MVVIIHGGAKAGTHLAVHLHEIGSHVEDWS